MYAKRYLKDNLNSVKDVKLFMIVCDISLLFVEFTLCFCLMLTVSLDHVAVYKRLFLRRHDVYATILFAVEQSPTEFHLGFFQFAE